MGNVMDCSISNYFLTGRMRIGKSTIISHILQSLSDSKRKIEGYRTKPIIDNDKVKGYVFENLGGVRKCFAHVDFKTDFKFDRYGVDISVFNELGAETLEQAVVNADLIVMDEIGMLEKEADQFKQSIMKCLSSEKIVLGAFQQRATWFSKILQNAITFQIDEKNRDTIDVKIVQMIKNLLTK